jgi:hypothetical protein
MWKKTIFEGRHVFEKLGADGYSLIRIDAESEQGLEIESSGEWTPTLSEYKSQAKDVIDQAAGRARARYITVAPGQEATYQAKATEADSYVAAERPVDTTPYPILTAEAQARGISVSDMADLVRTTRDQWIQLAAIIEALRVGGKLAVDAAVDHAGVDAARDEAIAQLEVV